MQVWIRYWFENKGRVFNLTLINTAFTVISEFVSRGVLGLWEKNMAYHFFTSSALSISSLNKQSLINIILTILASLIATPVFYFKNKVNRFLFFTCFAWGASLAAQALAGVIRSSPVTIDQSRVLFDIIYAMTIKFLIFEYYRPSLTDEDLSFSKLTVARGKQDLITAFFKNLLLNRLRFMGV